MAKSKRMGRNTWGWLNSAKGCQPSYFLWPLRPSSISFGSSPTQVNGTPIHSVPQARNQGGRLDFSIPHAPHPPNSPTSSTLHGYSEDLSANGHRHLSPSTAASYWSPTSTRAASTVAAILASFLNWQAQLFPIRPQPFPACNALLPTADGPGSCTLPQVPREPFADTVSAGKAPLPSISARCWVNTDALHVYLMPALFIKL